MSLIDGSLNRRNSIRGKDESGGGSFLGSGRRDLAGLTLDDVLGTDKKVGPSPTVAQITRTLLDVIRDDPEGGSFPDLLGQKDRKSWRSFKERLRRKRDSQAWTSTVHTPTSDIPITSSRSQMSRQSLTRFNSSKMVASSDDEPARGIHRESPTTEEMLGSDHEVACDYSSQSCSRSMMMRRTSSRFSSSGPVVPADSTEPEDLAGNVQAKALRPQISRHNSTRLGSSAWSRSLSRSESSMVRREDANGEDGAAIYGDELGGRSRRVPAVALQEERQLSAREAAAAQEAAEAAAAAVADRDEEGSDGEETEGSEAAQEPKRMSLMDLLEETDRQMGFVGSRYVVGDEEEEEEEEAAAAAAAEEEEGGEEGGGEYSCCVCMVRHKGSAFIPCGHTFCRMCSRELMVARGNCPLCNKFILEILDIF